MFGNDIVGDLDYWAVEGRDRDRINGYSLNETQVVASVLERSSAEITRLRSIIVRYGDRSQMSNAEPNTLQQSIDDAFKFSDGR